MARKPSPATRRRSAPQKKRQTGDGSGTPAVRGTSPWEWAAASVGGAILAFILGFLVYEGLSAPAAAVPDIVAVGGPPVRLPSGTFLVPIRVENRGHVTGANVTVRGSLLGEGGASVEESTASFDFVAQHSRETGGLYFTADPAGHRLVLRVEGYADP